MHWVLVASYRTFHRQQLWCKGLDAAQHVGTQFPRIIFPPSWSSALKIRFLTIGPPKNSLRIICITAIVQEHIVGLPHAVSHKHHRIDVFISPKLHYLRQFFIHFHPNATVHFQAEWFYIVYIWNSYMLNPVSLNLGTI